MEITRDYCQQEDALSLFINEIQSEELEDDQTSLIPNYTQETLE